MIIAVLIMTLCILAMLVCFIGAIVCIAVFTEKMIDMGGFDYDDE